MPSRRQRKMAAARSQRLREGPGKLIMPHGPEPWHFQQHTVHGNGFNGQIKHAWHPGTSMVIPGRGILYANK